MLRLRPSGTDYVIIGSYFVVVLGMLVFAGLMMFWALSRPTMPEPAEKRGQGSGADTARAGDVEAFVSGALSGAR
jgi:hypothetical protein